MSGNRKKYTPEYREQAVRLVVDTGRPIAHLAAEIGVGEQLLGRWVAAAKARLAADNPEVLDDDERAELQRLRKETAELRLDRAFLKNAAAFFASEQTFMAPFRSSGEDDTCDAEAIKHVANRVMDYHERLLEISERCRGLSVPSQYADILADCARLLDVPLQSYREFIAEMVDFVESLPRVLEHATGVVNMGAVLLDMDFDEIHEKTRIFKRLEAISKS